MAVVETLTDWINSQMKSTVLSFFHSSVDEQGKEGIGNKKLKKKPFRDLKDEFKFSHSHFKIKFAR